jgi:hypothetical protein
MTDDGEGEPSELLAEQRLSRGGLQVKLDKGFEEGMYCVYIEFDDLAARVGFAAARRMAGEYCDLLKSELRRSRGYALLGKTEDFSRSGDARRKRDLEATFLSFPVRTCDGRFHDDAMKEHFRVAFLRAGQVWDQVQASEQTHRRHTRQEQFRRQLRELLDGEAYAGVAATAKERLLDEIPPLAYPARGLEP